MKDCADETSCGGRREFLVKAGVMAGGMVLSLSGIGKAQQNTATTVAAKDAAGDEVVLKLDEKSPLSKVGGFETVETSAGKIVVVRIADAQYKAFSAVCPHKGGPIKYDEAAKQLFCPWHNSRFDADGKVVKGPAKTDLTPYQTENAVAVMIKK